MADLTGDDLVDRNANPNISRAFVQPDAGQENTIAARVIAAAIGPAIGTQVIQTAEDLQVLPDFFQWLERTVEFEIIPFSFRPPGGRDGAIREEHKGGAERGAAGSRGELANGRCGGD